jgi:hypothetical protein
MITKLLQSIALGLVLFTTSIAANDQSVSSIIAKSNTSHLTEKEQNEALLLRNDLSSRQDLFNLQSREKQIPESSYPDTACDPFPLPTEPIGPVVTVETERSGEEFYWSQWRYPCNEEFSWVVFTIEPKTNLDRPRICSLDVTIIQSGLEAGSLKLCADPYDVSCDSKCGDVIFKTSYALRKYSFTSDKIDLNKELYLSWDISDFTSDFTIDGVIPAYNPADYGGGGGSGLDNQNAVNGVFYDPNKPGHGFDFNMTQYGLIIYYYGHTKDGERLWLISSAYAQPIEYNVPIALTMYEVVNGTFNNPTPPETNWGSLTLTLTDCDTGIAVLSGIDGTFEMNFKRGTGLKGITCDSPVNGAE